MTRIDTRLIPKIKEVVDRFGINATFEVDTKNIIGDGEFKTGTPWTIEANAWTIDTVNNKVISNNATGNDQQLLQNDSLIIGKYYRIDFDIVDWVNNQVVVSCGSNLGTLRSTNGTYSQDLECTNRTSLEFTGVSGFSGSLKNIMVREIDGIGGNLITGAYDPTTRTYNSGKIENYTIKVSPPEIIRSYPESGQTKNHNTMIVLPASGLAFTPELATKVTINSVVSKIIPPIKELYSGEQIAAYEIELAG